MPGLIVWALPESFVHYLFMYDVVDDYVTRRAPLREAHLGLARAAVARGELVLGGALNPPEGVVLLFRGDSPAAAEAFAQADPYVQNGLVIGAGACASGRPWSARMRR